MADKDNETSRIPWVSRHSSVVAVEAPSPSFNPARPWIEVQIYANSMGAL